MRYGSLFSGIGGLDLGFELAGFECAWQVEIDSYARKVLAKHWPDVRRWDDVTTFPPSMADACSRWGQDDELCPRWYKPRVGGEELQSPADHDWSADVVIGGFPCQDISYAGKGEGLDGERSGLFYEAVRVISTLGPKYVVLENVAGLLTRGLDAVLGTLASIGYDAEWHCLQAADVGAPHLRDRIFIVAYAQGERLDRYNSRVGCGRRDEHPEGSPNGRCQVPDSDSWRQQVSAKPHGQSQRPGLEAQLGRDADRLHNPVPNAEHGGREGGHQEGKGSEATVPCGEATDSGGEGLQEREGAEGQWTYPTVAGGGWWDVEPGMGRVANGIPKRVDRLKCLGNAVVPQVAYWVAQRVLQIEEGKVHGGV